MLGHQLASWELYQVYLKLSQDWKKCDERKKLGLKGGCDWNRVDQDIITAWLPAGCSTENFMSSAHTHRMSRCYLEGEPFTSLTMSVTADPCPLLLTPIFTLHLVTEILSQMKHYLYSEAMGFGFGLQGMRVEGDSEAASAQVAGCSALLQAGSPSQWSRVPCTEWKRQSQHHHTLNSLMHSQEKSWNFDEKAPIWQSSSLPTVLIRHNYVRAFNATFTLILRLGYLTYHEVTSP